MAAHCQHALLSIAALLSPRRTKCASACNARHVLVLRMQDRVFPHGEFDAFICGVERLSGTNAVKSHMHDQRMRMLKVGQTPAQAMGWVGGTCACSR